MTATRTTTTAPVPNKATGYADNDQLLEAPDWVAVRPGGAFFSTVTDLRQVGRCALRQLNPDGGDANADVDAGHAERRHGGGLPGFIAQFHRYLDDRVSVIALNSDDADDETIFSGVAELYLPDRK
jgi:hypothetical protein